MKSKLYWRITFKQLQEVEFRSIKDALSTVRKFLATENLSRAMKKAFYFTLKPLLLLKIFKFLPWIFGHDEKRLD